MLVAIAGLSSVAVVSPKRQFDTKLQSMGKIVRIKNISFFFLKKE